jgi:hypothetical protein
VQIPEFKAEQLARARLKQQQLNVLMELSE